MSPTPGVLEVNPLREPIRLTTTEQYMMFDWSENRRKGVISGSQTILREFLKGKVEENDYYKIPELWENAVSTFQSPQNSSRLLMANEQPIAVCLPSELPTHSEYHVAKVVTLTTQLFDKALPKEYQTDENALALSLSAIIHDLGQLQKVGESGPQEKFYQHHELRAIELVDTIVDSLRLTEYTNSAQKAILKNKIKILIAATVPVWNLDYSGKGPKIDRLIKPGDNPVTKEEFMKDLSLTDSNKQNGLNSIADDLFTLFQSLSLPNSSIKQDEILTLSHIIGAADHGAYMLEPSRIAEIIGLWQEYNRMWIGPDGKLTHRIPPSPNYFHFLCSDFPKYQWNTYGSILQTLRNNPLALQSISIQDTRTYAEKIPQLLSEKSSRDSLFRFEGAFSPIQLAELADQIGLGNDRDIINAIVDFSRIFALRFHDAHSFDALATPVLRLMYQKIPAENRSVFLQKAMTTILQETNDELTKDGTLNFHIAPQAYVGKTQESIDEFLAHFEKAHQSLTDADRNRIATVYLTMREDRGDDLDIFRQTIKKYNSSHKKPPFAMSIAGMPSGLKIDDLIEQERKETYPLLIHFGLEKSAEEMHERLRQLLDKLPGDEKLFDRISIHLDDNFKEFMDYYNDHPDFQPFMKRLLKSISPLGYMLTGGEEAFNTMSEFYKTFTEDGSTKIGIGSNNPSMLGDLGLAGHQVVEKAFTK